MTSQRPSERPSSPSDDQGQNQVHRDVADLSDDECRDVARQSLAREKEVHNRSPSDSSGSEPSKGPSPRFFVWDTDLTKMSDEEIHELAEQLNQQLGELYNPP